MDYESNCYFTVKEEMYLGINTNDTAKISLV
jgi:hypothetical protein